MIYPKPSHLSNHCSLKRWIAVLAVGLLIGFTLCLPLYPLTENTEAVFMGLPVATIFSLLSFAPLFVGMLFAIRFVGKTSIKAFVLGRYGSVDGKQCLLVAGLFAVGFAASLLMALSNLRATAVNGGDYAFLVVFMLPTVFMQTVWEELLYRGLTLRWACQDRIGYSKKTMLVGVVSSMVFALSHAVNPEVTTQDSLQTVLALLAYAFAGFMYFLADVHFGNLLPGMIMHWMNNFLLFTLVSSDTTAVSSSTPLIDTTPQSGLWILLSTVVVYLPLLLYILADLRKTRKAA